MKFTAPTNSELLAELEKLSEAAYDATFSLPNLKDARKLDKAVMAARAAIAKALGTEEGATP